ncbi:P-loop ATPase, Sll1717 family [Rhizobium giardinii]|uniref:P-loop ATPase, Sll1717 family n=1 Tax=Rhizobium giardinii TaxID=56731 RepID=UPI0039E036F0
MNITADRSCRMVIKKASAFLAYPGQPSDLVSTIDAAGRRANGGKASIVTWPEMGVFGQVIPDHVRRNIQEAAAVIFDITRPNLNVYYEAGYAIGLGKPVAPVVNTSFQNATSDIQRDGLFDNIGYKTYENSEQLADILSDLPTTSLVELYGRELDNQQPLFILDTLRKTDFRNAVVSAVKASKVHFRSFDPVEVPRLSTVTVITQLTASSGIVLPILGEHIEDALRHNLRAAFLAGLGHGLGRQTLLLEMRRFDAAGPADYRDMVAPVVDDKAITELVGEFSQTALLAAQSIRSRPGKSTKSALQTLTLGSSAAENEFRTLASYFVETAEFVRTLRGEINVVAGRKGSGKTAIFFQARDNFREEKGSIVTDLKPESHQLSLFREELLKIVDVGAFDHSLAAFWYFLLLSEVLLTIRRNFEFKARFNGEALTSLREIDEVLDAYQINESGDFTTRINRLSRFVLEEIEAAKKRRQTISPEFLTNVIFRGGITDLKKITSKYVGANDLIVLLFDNIDKGWPTNGVDEFDVRLVRLLIETLDKIKRDFAAAKRDFMSVVFLRNDIYEMLVEGTPDRGKAGQARIDWTDRAKLKQVILKRLQASSREPNTSFNQLWNRFFPEVVQGQDSFEFMVDHCLMRPRFLINIIENAISNAVNRGHEKVGEEDCVDAVRQHSLYLVDDFGYEIRDVSGLSAELLYSLVGAEKIMTKAGFQQKFCDFGLEQEDAEKAFTLMLWYGVLGIRTKDHSERFIYDYEYNMKRLNAEARILGEEVLYVTNAALHVALAA